MTRRADPGPARLVPLPFGVARDVPEERHRDLPHALPVAGPTARPDPPQASRPPHRHHDSPTGV
ncbi:hypothetical protein ABT269_09715 [Streptomyces viridosporus]|uniref:hypothetical protein n=1 Tax=Streptomyces viridosporus TaxID=67581 RepID=UPI003323BE46